MRSGPHNLASRVYLTACSVRTTPSPPFLSSRNTHPLCVTAAHHSLTHITVTCFWYRVLLRVAGSKRHLSGHEGRPWPTGRETAADANTTAGAAAAQAVASAAAVGNVSAVVAAAEAARQEAARQAAAAQAAMAQAAIAKEQSERAQVSLCPCANTGEFYRNADPVDGTVCACVLY